MGYGLIWLWGHKRSSARVQVRAGVTWLGLQRGQQDVVRSLAGPAWCLTARYPLFLRRRAPRPLTESGFEAGRRGASPPVNPCFFVTGHHVGWANRSMGTDGVVPHRPQTLVSSSRDTTPLALVEPSEEPAWCFAARKPLFLRQGVPRRMGESAFGTGWRGASSPANPCFFVEGHHAIGPGRAFG